MSENKFNGIGPSAGFTYQEYYFLLRLLKMKPGESVSFEKVDDVGVETDDSQVLYQLKHTVATTKSHIEKLSPRDIDLWKTLHLWVCLIQDRENDEEKRTVEEQKFWIERSEFILIINKDTAENDFYNDILSFRSGGITLDEIKENLEQLEIGTKDVKIKRFIEDLINLKPIEEFLRKISFVFMKDDDILNKICEELRDNHYVPEEKTRFVMELLLGAIKADYPHTIQANTPLVYTKEQFVNNFRQYIIEYSQRKFMPSSRFTRFDLPLDPWNQTFVRQLTDIKDLKKGKDIDILNVYTQSMLRFQNDYLSMVENMGVSTASLFEREVNRVWNNAFKCFTPDEDDTPSEKEIMVAAKQVLAKVREKDLMVEGDKVSLGIDYSNGCFYYFSDGTHPKIGWRMDWMEKYKGIKWITD